MEYPRHPYRKLSCRTTIAEGDSMILAGAAAGGSLRLTRSDYQLALLFDGEHDARSISIRAREQQLEPLPDARSVANLALRLSEAGLLEPGRFEPLPVPEQNDSYARKPGRSLVNHAAVAAPEVNLPSSLPGNLTAPSHSGSLVGLWAPEYGAVASMQMALDVRRWLPLGHALNFPLFGSRRLICLIAVAIGIAFALFNHRLEFERDLARLLPLPRALLLALLLGYLCNALTELARAAAISRCTRSRPRFGITSGMLGIPHFYTDTSGAAEAAGRVARMRIVGATLTCGVSLFVTAALAWLMFERHGGFAGPIAAGSTLLFIAFLFLQANPFAKRDGYNLLMQALRISDLRESARFALFGRERPWNSAKPPPAGLLWLYAGLMLLYTIWLLVWLVVFPAAWLKAYLGPITVILIAACLAYLGYRIAYRSMTDRSNIGEKNNVSLFDEPVKWMRQVWQGCRQWLIKNKPGKRGKIIIGVVAVICLFPYPYDPSGDFIVLPNARADVRAQLPGAVRKVLVKEGDEVKAGAVLAQLADEDEKAQLAAAQAELVKMQSDLALAKQGRKHEEIDQARQEVSTAAKRYQFSREDANRFSAAFQRKAVSEEDYKRALSLAEVNQQQLLEAQRHLDVVGSATSSDEIKSLEAQVERQKSLVDYQQAQEDYTTLKSPIDGRVVSGSLQFAVGNYLQRGDKLATIEDSNQLQVEIQVTEDDIDQIKVGSKAWAKAWSAPGSAYPGRVVSIAPSAQNETYGRVVRVYMNIDQPDGRLRPEMTGYAKIRGRWYPLIMSFTRPVVRFLLVEMWSWLP